MPTDDLAQLKRDAEAMPVDGVAVLTRKDLIRLLTRLERAEKALLKAFELQRVCLDAMSARPGRFHNREGYTIRVALEEFSSARAALPEEPTDD